jgi:DNA topoisomerase-3
MFKLNWVDSKNNSQHSFNKERIETILSKVENKNAEIAEINKIHKKKYSSGLYDLTELQRDANKIFNFSAKETLSIMQKLYEHHKVLTYPRTDSKYISTDIVDTLKDRVRAVSVSD